MITLIPAYGRDYTSKAKVLADWNNGKDFIIASFGHPYDGKPANKQDMGGEQVSIRYKGLKNIAVI